MNITQTGVDSGYLTLPGYHQNLLYPPVMNLSYTFQSKTGYNLMLSFVLLMLDYYSELIISEHKSNGMSKETKYVSLGWTNRDFWYSNVTKIKKLLPKRYTSFRDRYEFNSLATIFQGNITIRLVR